MNKARLGIVSLSTIVSASLFLGGCSSANENTDTVDGDVRIVRVAHNQSARIQRISDCWHLKSISKKI